MYGPEFVKSCSEFFHRTGQQVADEFRGNCSFSWKQKRIKIEFMEFSPHFQLLNFLVVLSP